MPGYHAHNGFRCKSKLLFPTRISRSCSGELPQQPRVVIRTTRTVCGISRSTRHHGDGSFCVSEHFCSSGFSLPNWPSLAKAAGPARVVDDWLTGLRYATLIPKHFKKTNLISNKNDKLWNWFAIKRKTCVPNWRKREAFSNRANNNSISRKIAY